MSDRLNLTEVALCNNCNEEVYNESQGYFGCDCRSEGERTTHYRDKDDNYLTDEEAEGDQ